MYPLLETDYDGDEYGPPWQMSEERTVSVLLRLTPALNPTSMAYLHHDAGSVYSLCRFGTRMLVINSADAARDLLELRSAKYANRRLTAMVKLCVLSVEWPSVLMGADGVESLGQGSIAGWRANTIRSAFARVGRSFTQLCNRMSWTSTTRSLASISPCFSRAFWKHQSHSYNTRDCESCRYCRVLLQ